MDWVCICHSTLNFTLFGDNKFLLNYTHGYSLNKSKFILSLTNNKGKQCSDWNFSLYISFFKISPYKLKHLHLKYYTS
jgi:hypothetical protein